MPYKEVRVTVDWNTGPSYCPAVTRHPLETPNLRPGCDFGCFSSLP